MLKAESEVLFERRAVLSQKVLDHGRALMTPLLEQIKDEGRNDPHKAQFKKPIDMFELAIDLEPEGLTLLMHRSRPFIVYIIVVFISDTPICFFFFCRRGWCRFSCLGIILRQSPAAR